MGYTRAVLVGAIGANLLRYTAIYHSEVPTAVRVQEWHSASRLYTTCTRKFRVML